MYMNRLKVQDDEGNYDLVRDQLREKAKVQLMGGADTGNLKVTRTGRKPATDAPEEASAAPEAPAQEAPTEETAPEKKRSQKHEASARY